MNTTDNRKRFLSLMLEPRSPEECSVRDGLNRRDDELVSDPELIEINSVNARNPEELDHRRGQWKQEQDLKKVAE